MAYSVHNFEQGDVLYAEQLNEMDAQIAANEENIENGVSTNMLAEDYSANKTYSIGDYVIYNNELYTCIYEITAAEGWNAAHWQSANLGDGISDLSRQISDIDNILNTPMSMSRTGVTAYQFVTVVEGIQLNKDQQYLITFKALSTPTGPVYCYLRDSSDATLANTSITADLTESTITYKPTQDYSDCTLKIRITGTVSAGITVYCEIKENKENVIAEIKKDVSAQDAITGYRKPNLLSNSFPNYSGVGITLTVNEDKSVTIQGTTTSTFNVNISETLPKGKYIFSGCNGGSPSSYYMRLIRADNTYFDIYGGRETQFEISSDSETVKIYIYIINNTVINATLYPMIRPADVYNPTYAPYGAYQIYKPIQELIDYTQFNWSGKKMNVIGDSIVAGSYGNFIIPIRDILCLSEARNYGVGGSCLASSAQDADYPPAVLRYTSMDTDAQIIIVHAGTNDYSAQIPLGDDNSTDITTFNGALNVMMNGLREMYPTALIIFDSILHRYNDGALTIPASAYREAIENRCLANHVVFYDAYKYSGFDFVKGYYDHILTSDGLHPNQTGANILGRKLAGFIRWN